MGREDPIEFGHFSYFCIFYITINQQDAAVRSQFYFTAGSLYMFRVLSTPIIRSAVSTASGTGHIIVAATFFQRGQVWTKNWPHPSSGVH